MDRTETEKLISLIEDSYANFKSSDSIVFTWQSIFDEAKISYLDAVSFVKQHIQAGNKFYPVPGEIIQGVREWTKTPLPAYQPMGTVYEGDAGLLKRFPKLAYYDSYTRQLLETSIRHRDAVRSGRVPRSPNSDPGANESRATLAARERRIAECHRQCAAGLDTTDPAQAQIYMQRVKDWFNFSTGNIPVPRGTTFTKKPTQPLALPAPKEPPNP